MVSRPWSRVLSAVVLAAALALIFTVTVRIGIVPLRLYEHDIFFLIDNAYRVLQGQVPNRDFSSAWGPVTYLIEATGLLVAGMRPAGVGYANAIFGSLIALWAWWIGRKRWSPSASCLLGIYTALLITAPYSLGWGTLNFSFAMVYNRYGYAILGILLVECAAPADTAGGVSTGIAWALLGWLKISYAAMAVPFILLSLVWFPAPKRRLAAIVSAAALVSLLALAYLRFDLRDILRDLLMASSGRVRSWTPREILLGFGQFAETIPLAILSVLAGDTWKDRAQAAALTFFTLLVGGILISTNRQASGVPLNGYAAVVLGSLAIRRYRVKGAVVRTCLVAILSTLCFLPTAFRNGISLAYAVSHPQEFSAIPGSHLAAPRAAGMTFAPAATRMTTETGGPPYVAAVNDGLDLLRRRTGPRDGVLTMDHLNPFNYLLGRPSPRGGMAAAAYNFVFSDARHLTADEFFGDARYIMVRKYSPSAGDYRIEISYSGGTLKLYRGALSERFHLIEETPHWQLWGSQIADAGYQANHLPR